jgi:ribulose-phosphate 3-epimerase
MQQIKIAPSILAADFTRLGEQIQQAEGGGADLIHIDVMDGCFVPNITMGPQVVRAVRRVTRLPLDVHLMIVEPEKHVEAFAEAGADRITVHSEASVHLHRTLMLIRSLDCRAGVALNPHTPASNLSEIISMIDQIIAMTVNPGFGGQRFIVETLPKITRLREMITATGRVIDLEVDGGISTETAGMAVAAGADVMIAGTEIFNEGRTVRENIAALRRAAAGD